ncbi:MAG: pyridoxal phosphate-dependent aminotransferase [Xanthomonadales bacterium]|nr:pyridoxal phosphate-dependent aminotransferase [Xanthomonadales bacterium]
MHLSQRVQSIKPSATITVTKKAIELREAGVDVVSLSAGEPDFATPEHIQDAARAAMAAGQTKYTAVDGTSELKAAIIGKLQRDSGLDYQPGQILVTSGAKQAIFNACLALLEEGNEAVIPAPYWVSYPDMVGLADATPVIISGGVDQDFKITPEQLAEAITDQTRMFIFNSPSNPTGKAYNPGELAALGEVLRQHPGVVVVADDIYESIYWGEEPLVHLLEVCPDLYGRTLVINGVSKAYAMTGWRIGYAAGPEAAIAAMRKIQGQSTSNACSISQAAAVAAISGDQSCVEDMTRVYRQRHDAFSQSLDALPGVTCLPGNGAFYLMPDFIQVIRERGFHDDVDLAADILEKANVALVPGSAFGAPGHLRVSYATSGENLEKALERLREYLS